MAVLLTSMQFETESNFDYVSIGGTQWGWQVGGRSGGSTSVEAKAGTTTAHTVAISVSAESTTEDAGGVGLELST